MASLTMLLHGLPSPRKGNVTDEMGALHASCVKIGVAIVHELI